MVRRLKEYVTFYRKTKKELITLVRILSLTVKKIIDYEYNIGK